MDINRNFTVNFGGEKITRFSIEKIKEMSKVGSEAEIDRYLEGNYQDAFCLLFDLFPLDLSFVGRGLAELSAELFWKKRNLSFSLISFSKEVPRIEVKHDTFFVVSSLHLEISKHFLWVKTNSFPLKQSQTVLKFELGIRRDAEKLFFSLS